MPDHLSSVLPDIAARAVQTRRDLHRFPELGMIEFRTASALIRESAEALLRARATHLADRIDDFHLTFQRSVDRFSRLPLPNAFCRASPAERAATTLSTFR